MKGPILLTGAHGFVGTALAQEILKSRQDLVCIGRRLESPRGFPALKDCTRVLDLTRVEEVREAVFAVKPATVFHLAAYGGSPSQKLVSKILNVNVGGTANLLEALQSMGGATLINAGSSSEYGFNCAGPSETAELRPNSTYSISKAAVSSLLQDAHRRGSVHAINLRLYSVYGPLEATSRLVPNAVRSAINGTFPPLAQRDISRDFIFIEDVVEAFLIAAVKAFEAGASGNFNIGTGIATTLGEFAGLLGDLFKIKEVPAFGTFENRDWDLPDWFANPARAHDLLGWRATTPLREGLARTGDWVSTLSESGWRELASNV